MIDYQAVINRIISEANSFLGKGKIADYIPALAEVSSDRLGIAVNLVDGRTFKTGDADIPFSIQSISKFSPFPWLSVLLEKIYGIP